MGTLPNTNPRALSSSPARLPTHIRVAAFSDYTKIAALEKRNGLAPRPRDEWGRLWQANPACSSLKSEWPIGWVLETSQDEIVGAISNIALAYTFGGHKYLAATACGWVVDPDYRRFSLPLLGQFARQPGIDLIICTTIGATAENCYRLFGFSRVPSGQWNRSDYWVTGCRGFAESALRAKSILAAGPLSYPASAVLFVRNRLHMLRTPPASPDLEIASCPGFDDRMDEFWEELESRHLDRVLAVRDRESLTWHFQLGLDRKSIWILRAFRNSRLIAYAVFARQDKPLLGLKRVCLIDFQGLSEHHAALHSILHHALRQCQSEGIHVLEIIGGWQMQPELGRISAPYHRSLNAWTQYFRANNENLARALKDPASWTPSQYDGDASI